MRKPSLTLTILLLACGDDATPSDTNDDTGGSTSDTSGPTTSASTSGMSASTSASTTATTTDETSSSTTEESSTTMGPAPACGDGNLDEGEECDDGNTDQDDACTAMCTIPFTVEWTVSYNGPASNMDGTGGVLVDGEGNIVVVGFHRTIDDANDVWLQQYAPDGSELWNFTWSGGLGLNDVGSGLAFHPSGDVIIAGYTESVEDDIDVLVMRVPFDGAEPTWVVTYDGPGTGKEGFDNADSANAVTVDGNGDIVAVGSERVDGERSNVWVSKYDGDGNEVWTETYNGAESENDACSDVVVDAANNIYVACFTRETDGASTGWIRRYDEQGNVDWTEQTPWLPAGITLDSDENIILTGTVDTGTIDIIVGKYDSTFTEIWSQTINGPAAGGDVGRDVVTDAEGNVYLIGTIAVTNQQDDIYVHKFDVDGNDQWAYSYNNEEADLGDYGSAIAVDADGNVYATGNETVFGEQRNAWTTKIVQH